MPTSSIKEKFWFLPLQDLPLGWRVNPTGQLQRTPVDVSLQVLSQPPLLSAHVSEEHKKERHDKLEKAGLTEKASGWSMM